MCFYFRSVLFPYIKGSLRKITNTAAAEINNNNNNNNNCSANNFALAGIDITYKLTNLIHYSNYSKHE
jgi:hypothetical protein